MRLLTHAAACIGALMIVLGLASPPANATERLLWNWATRHPDGTYTGGIAAADPDTGKGRNLPLTSAFVDHPLGVVADSVSGRLHWGNFGSSKNYCDGPPGPGQGIFFASPTGSGRLNTTGATVMGPDGLSIDPVTRRLYWANDVGNSISYANLDGSGGGDLKITGATLKCPTGLAIDPAARRVYWTNYRGDTISYANLDGSGAADLRIHGVTVYQPWGLAIDSLHGKIYWANFGSDSIDYAYLDGSDGNVLNTRGADVVGPWGLALDPFEGKIYWANNTGASLGWAWVDGSGAGKLGASGAPVDHPKAPILVQSPAAVEPPLISGKPDTRSLLACTDGRWAADLPEAFLFREPSWFAYSWTRNGSAIPGTSRSIVADSPGSYSCRVTGTNYAGSASQSSAPFEVRPAARVGIAVASASVSSSGAITMVVNVTGSGTVTGRGFFWYRSRAVPYGNGSTSGTGSLTLTINPSRWGLKLFASGRRTTVMVAIVFTRVDGSVARTTASVWVGGRSPKRR